MKFLDEEHIIDRLRLLAAPVPPEAIQWRQDGRPSARRELWFARFVAYIDAQFAQARLDAIFPGEWTLHHDLLPERGDEDGVLEVGMKAVLTIAGIVREGIGTGKDYKSAASDSFKRACVRFGLAAELYDYGVNWVQVDSDGKFAKPVEDPGLAYARKQQKLGEPPRHQRPPMPPPVRALVNAAIPDPYDGQAEANDEYAQEQAAEVYNAGVRDGTLATRAAYANSAAPPAPAPARPEAPSFSVPKAMSCPICGSNMWDNRLTKTGKQPDYKCKTKTCDGAVWLPTAAKKKTAMPVTAPADTNDFPDALRDDQDNLPF